MKVSQQASGASLPGMIRCGLIALCLSVPLVAAGEEAMPCAVSSDTNASKPMATVMSWPSLTTPTWAAD